MRCQEVTQELAVPTGKMDPAALAAHLEACPQCASVAEGFERLDQIWSATRPAEPPFEASWAAVCRQIDEPSTAAATAVGSSRHVSLRMWRWVQVGSGLAAAAALLLAGLIMFQHRGAGPDRPNDIVQHQTSQPQVAAPNRGQLAQADSAPAPRRSRGIIPIPVSDGRLVMIDLDDLEVDQLSPRDGTNMVAADFELLDAFEAMGQ